MANIGEPLKEVTFEPVEMPGQPAPVEPAVPAQEPVPAK